MTAQQNYYNARRKLIDEGKARPCADCGHTFPSVCMDYDHRDPSSKLFSIAHFQGYGYQAIRDEMSKCDVVCANCHRIRTHDLRDTQQTLF